VKTAQMLSYRSPRGSQTGHTPRAGFAADCVGGDEGEWRGAADGGELVSDAG
jgi:hypothetical protein